MRQLAARSPPTLRLHRPPSLNLDRQLFELESAQTPDKYPLNVFIGSERNELRLRKVRVRIDELHSREYEYAQSEWQAIANGAVHPAWSGRVAAGNHRLRVEVYARALDADPNDPRAVEWIDQTITIGDEESLEITLVQKRFGGAEINVKSWPGSVRAANHPWLRAAQYWLWSDRPYLAARILSRQRSAGKALPAEYSALAQQSVQQFVGAQSLADSSALLERARMLESATAQLQTGNAAALLALADQEAKSEPLWVVRDNANLLLGYHFLRGGQVKQAREALGKVRSPGPHAHEAMLGYGWTFLLDELAPDAWASSADTSHPNFVLAAAQASASDSGQLDDEDREDALRSALVPWTELIGADVLDIAAQEGALAVAWALDELDTGEQAHTYYERSAAQLAGARGLLSQAMEHVASGHAAKAFADGLNDESSGWKAWLSDLPYASDTRYLKALLKSPNFVDQLDDFRAAQLLADELAACEKRALDLPQGTTADTLVRQVAQARKGHEPQLFSTRTLMERTALDLLRDTKARIERYLAYAHFAMARHYDSEPEPEFEIIKGDAS